MFGKQKIVAQTREVNFYIFRNHVDVFGVKKKKNLTWFKWNSRMADIIFHYQTLSYFRSDCKLFLCIAGIEYLVLSSPQHAFTRYLKYENGPSTFQSSEHVNQCKGKPHNKKVF